MTTKDLLDEDMLNEDNLMLDEHLAKIVATAKRIAKKEKLHWIKVYTDIIIDSLVNQINEDSNFWIKLKETFVGKEKQ